jgi:hypothetical protein
MATARRGPAANVRQLSEGIGGYGGRGAKVQTPPPTASVAVSEPTASEGIGYDAVAGRWRTGNSIQTPRRLATVNMPAMAAAVCPAGLFADLT